VSLSVSAPQIVDSVLKRSALFAAAAVGGVLAGIGWNLDLSNWAYAGFLQTFLDPGAPVAGLGVGVALAFLVGFVHLVTPCYLPAVLAALPLVQGAQARMDWIRTTLVLAGGMVLVTGLFGAIVGAAGGAFSDLATSPRMMSLVMKPLLIAMGLVMLVIALGELGLVRRLLPEAHLATSAVSGTADFGGHSQYRQVAILGLGIAATFGIVCTAPPYLALVVYVAAVGSVAYGALTLGVYGVGLAVPIVLVGLAMVPGNRSGRFMDWMGARQGSIHVAQGMLLAFLGALVVAFFWFRYGIPSA
jgi:thioredoxin:protein disulfide reductase